MFVVVAHLTPHSSLARNRERERETEMEDVRQRQLNFPFLQEIHQRAKAEKEGVRGDKVIRQLCINSTNLSTAPNDKRRLREEQEKKQGKRGDEVEKKRKYNREEWKRLE